MRKLVYFLFIFAILVLSTFTLAVRKAEAKALNSNAANRQNEISISPTVSPTGIQVKNKNQIQTQNKGEEQQLQIQTREEEGERGESLQTRSQVALEHMSEVAIKVQQLLQVKNSGGIGEQVRQVAREQNQAQEQISTELEKINSRGRLARFFFGGNYQAVRNLEKLLEQNQLRIQQLQQLENKLTNQADLTKVQETIQALIQENTSIQERIEAEVQIKSLFGWLLQLFVS